MPMAIEPGGVCRIVLASDRHKAKPPTFLFPYLTARQQRQLMRGYDFGAGSMLDIDSIFADLSRLLLGWENLPVGFAPGELDAVISVAEAFELINQLIMQGPSSAEKNAYGSPPA